MNSSQQFGSLGQSQNQPNPISHEQVNFEAELSITQAQLDDYKSKYFQAVKDIERYKQEIDSLRAMLQQTQSLRGSDPRQADDLRRNITQLQQENSQLKQEVVNIQNNSQQQQQQVQQQPMAQIEAQQRILQLQNELNIQSLQMQGSDMLLKQKQTDYEQLRVRVQAREFINSIPAGQEQNRLLVLQRENQRLNEIINQRDSQLETLRITVNEQRMVSQERDTLSSQLREYEEKIVNLSRELERLLTSVGGLRHDVLLKSEFERVKQALNASERESKDWRDKYQRLEHDSSHLVELEKQKQELENRVTKLQEEVDKIELENRGMQLRQQAFDRLLKEKEQMQQKLQEMDSAMSDQEKQMQEKRRESENLKRQNKEKDEDFINFKENIYRPLEDRGKRLELDIENWRNKCLALENNFFGNNERFYVENEFRRLHGIVLAQQQENEELKIKLRTMRQSAAQPEQQETANEERTKLLYAERERLFTEMEQLRKKCQSLEQDLGSLRTQGYQSTQQHIQIIQDGGSQDKQVEELKQGIGRLIDENRALKQLQDSQQMQIEQLQIDKSYFQLHSKDLNHLDMLSRGDFNPQQNSLQSLAKRLYEQVQQKERELVVLKQGMNASQRSFIEQVAQKDEELKFMSSQQQGHLKESKQMFAKHQREAEDQGQKDTQFVELLEQKDRLIEQMERKFSELQHGDQRVIFTNDLKRLRDMLELRSYEAQEWKDKYQLMQGQLRHRDNQVNSNPMAFSNALLEQEYRNLRQMHEMKTMEAEEYKKRLLLNNQDVTFKQSDVEGELRKCRMLLEMRTAECEEWRQKCLRVGNNQGGGDVGATHEQIRYHQQMSEAKTRECDELRSKYAEVIKGRDKGSASLIDDLQNEVRRHQRLHEKKSLELQEAQPLIQKAQNVQRERDVLEHELRRMKQVLEQQIIENETLKRKLSSGVDANNNNQGANDKLYFERQLRDQHTKIQQLQAELQLRGGQLQDKNLEHDRLKQTHNMQQDQIKSVAMGQTHHMKDLHEDHDKLKMTLRDKMREVDDLKTHQKKFQAGIQMQQQEILELKKGGQSTEALKAQATILQHKLQEMGNANQLLQQQLTKMGNALKDLSVENQGLKQNLQKVDAFKKEKDVIVAQLQQIKTALEAKQKENEQLRNGLMQLQTKYQELQSLESHTNQHHDKLTNLVQDFGGGLKRRK